jgi:prophage regulatory protein
MNTIQIGVLRLPAVTQKVGLSRSTIYLLMQRGEFPRPVQLSLRAVGWYQTDVDAWLQSRKCSGVKEVA